MNTTFHETRQELLVAFHARGINTMPASPAFILAHGLASMRDPHFAAAVLKTLRGGV